MTPVSQIVAGSRTANLPRAMKSLFFPLFHHSAES